MALPFWADVCPLGLSTHSYNHHRTLVRDPAIATTRPAANVSSPHLAGSKGCGHAGSQFRTLIGRMLTRHPISARKPFSVSTILRSPSSSEPLLSRSVTS